MWSSNMEIYFSHMYLHVLRCSVQIDGWCSFFCSLFFLDTLRFWVLWERDNKIFENLHRINLRDSIVNRFLIFNTSWSQRAGQVFRMKITSMILPSDNCSAVSHKMQSQAGPCGSPRHLALLFFCLPAAIVQLWCWELSLPAVLLCGSWALFSW